MQEEDEKGEFAQPDGVWLRGLWMLILLVLFSLAEKVMWAVAVLQFAWMLFARRKNPHIAGFGEKLGNWMAMTARFQAGESEEKPFPWTQWR